MISKCLEQANNAVNAQETFIDILKEEYEFYYASHFGNHAISWSPAQKHNIQTRLIVLEEVADRVFGLDYEQLENEWYDELKQAER